MMIKWLLTFLIMAGAGMGTDYGFGGDTTATTGWGISDSTVFVHTATSPANSGTLDSAVAFLADNYNGPFTVQIVIYNSDSTFLDSTANFTVNTGNQTKTRFRADFQVGASVSASTQYFIGHHHLSGNGTIRTFYTGTTGTTWRYDQGNVGVPASFVSDLTSNKSPIAVWLFYSDASGATTPTKIIGKAKLGKVKL